MYIVWNDIKLSELCWECLTTLRSVSTMDEQCKMDRPETLSKKIRTIFYSHTKTEISKIFLSFYQETEISKKKTSQILKVNRVIFSCFFWDYNFSSC